MQWLDTLKISGLCRILDDIWMEQPGQEVLYPWVEWLRSSSLSFLGVDGVRLVEHEVWDTADQRSISGSVSLEVDIPLMISYSDERCHEAFLNDLHLCVICYDECACTFLSQVHIFFSLANIFFCRLRHIYYCYLFSSCISVNSRDFMFEVYACLFGDQIGDAQHLGCHFDHLCTQFFFLHLLSALFTWSFFI